MGYKFAKEETIEYFLDLPELKDEWVDDNYIILAMRSYRDNIALLLAKDGRCLANVEGLIEESVYEGCRNTFFYLIDNYPNNISDLFALAPYAALYDLEDVLNKIESFDNYHGEENTKLIKSVRTGNVRLPCGYADETCKYFIIKGGHLLSAYPLIGSFDDGGLFESIVLGIREGKITNLDELEPYSTRREDAYGLILIRLIECPYQSLDVIRYLSNKSKNIKWLPDIVTKALYYGNWEYANVISEYVK